MTKKNLLSALLSVLLLTAFSYTDFAGKDVAILVGAITHETAGKIGVNAIYYSDASVAAEDVRRGRVCGFLSALSHVRVITAQLGGDVFDVIPIPTEIFSARVGGISMKQDIIDRFNAFLSVVKSDGTLEEMRERWFGEGLDLDAPMPDIPNTGENGVLRVATASISMPYAFIGANGELKGFSVELALRFGAHEGMSVEFADMEFGALIPYIVSGRADFSIAGMAITEERRQSVLFTDSFHEEQHGILVLRPGGEAELHYTDFAGKRIGMVTGTIWDRIIVEYIGGTPAYYTDTTAGIEDVRRGRADGFMHDLMSTRILISVPGNEDLIYTVIPAEIFSTPMGAVSLDTDIIDRFNIFLADITEDGTLADMRSRWIEVIPDLDAPMPCIQPFPCIPPAGTYGTLRVATCAASMPFVYMGDCGELKGYSIELVRRFAEHEGMGIEFSEMDFGGIVPYVASGRADLGIADISITEERKESVLFTDSIHDDLAVIIALRPGGAILTEPEGAGFIHWLRTSIERNLITDNRWRLIVDGLGVTMTIAFMSQIFGTLFGLFVCWLLTRGNRLVKRLGGLYCGLIHGTPMVVLLMITYYIILGGTDLSNVFIAIVAFTMTTGAGVAGNLKGAIETVDPTEIEAARSLGFSAFRAFLLVTLPQAARRALPGYTRGFVELVKATAIVGYIAIQDLTRAGDIIRSRTYDAYFPLLFVAAIYLIITTACVQLFKFIIAKINRSVEM